MNYGLEVLVDDLLIHILSILSVWDVLSVRQTSKRLESLSHVRNVWHSIFRREVVEPGRPIPGYSFSITPRLLALFGLSESDLSVLSSAPLNDSYLDLIEASDLEARTLHALRLEKHWKRTTPELGMCGLAAGAHSASRSFSFRTLETIREVFLLFGGRYVVTVHSDRLRCWDIGFPRPSNQDLNVLNIAKKSQTARCVGEWVLPSDIGQFTSLMDASEPSNWQFDNSAYFAVCPVNDVSWSEHDDSASRTCSVLSVRYDPLRAPGVLPFNPDGSPSNSPVPAFSHEVSIRLPNILRTPVYTNRAEPVPAHRFGNGKLGSLIHAHGSLLFFASYVRPAETPNEEGPNGASAARYAGIEVIDWSRPHSPLKSVLLEYPDPQVGAYVGMYVHESADHILVVWQNCIGLYPVPRFSEPTDLSYPSSETSRSRSASPETVPERVVLMPTIIFALSEVVEQPISFSTCHASGLNADVPTGGPRPLTILARSQRHPHLTMQSVLTAFWVPPAASASSDAARSTPPFRFRLSRIPASTPHAFAADAAGQDGVAALVLGPSGRGVRADGGGAVYRCAPADVLLPRFGYGGPEGGGPGGWGGRVNSGLVATVDFWPYRRVDSLPGSGPLDAQERERRKLVVRFDDGMGRMVVTRVAADDSDSNVASEVTVVDFA
ncbi:hypothetical protein DFH11DRAFT_1627638 [Phellopilus nigrolimitatus]|nr:hypothetical protein DFH11DRAFT_1627638 [Phellopilus nigrolimitatus]